MIGRVTDQRPTGAVRLAEEIRAAPRQNAASSRWRREAFREIGRQRQRLKVIALDIFLVRLEFGIRPAGDHKVRSSCVGTAKSAIRPNIGLECARSSASRSSSIVGASNGGFSLYPSAFTAFATIEFRPSAPITRARARDGPPSFEWPLMPTTRPSFHHDLFDVEAFADFGAGFGRRVDKQLVEDGPPRTVRDRSIPRARRPGDRDGTEVEGVGMDRRASCCDRRSSRPHRRGPLLRVAARGGSIACRSETLRDRQPEHGSPCGPEASRSVTRHSGLPPRSRRTNCPSD